VLARFDFDPAPGPPLCSGVSMVHPSGAMMASAMVEKVID